MQKSAGERFRAVEGCGQQNRHGFITGETFNAYLLYQIYSLENLTELTQYLTHSKALSIALSIAYLVANFINRQHNH